jgi:plastocyanin
MNMRPLRIAMVVTIGATLVAGCGGSSSNNTSKSTSKPAKTTSTTTATSATPATGGTTLDLGVVSGQLKFNPTTLTAPAGKVTLVLTNNDPSMQHSIAVDDPSGNGVGKEGEVVGSGKTSTTSFDAKPGVYTFYCTIHEGAGMTGKLTIT